MNRFGYLFFFLISLSLMKAGAVQFDFNSARVCVGFISQTQFNERTLSANFSRQVSSQDFCQAAETAWNLSKRSNDRKIFWQTQTIQMLIQAQDFSAAIGEGLAFFNQDAGSQENFELRSRVLDAVIHIAETLGPMRDPTFLYYALKIHELIPKENLEAVRLPDLMSLEVFIQQFSNQRTRITPYQEKLRQLRKLFVVREVQIAETLRRNRPAAVLSAIYRLNFLARFPFIQQTELNLLPIIQRAIFMTEFIRLLYPDSNGFGDLFSRDAVLVDARLFFESAFPEERLRGLQLPNLVFNEATQKFDRQRYACRLIPIIDSIHTNFDQRFATLSHALSAEEVQILNQKRQRSETALRAVQNRLRICAAAE